MKSLRTTTMWSRTTGIQREWEERGGTIIRTTSKQHISGAMKEKDRPDWMTDGPSVVFGSLLECPYQQDQQTLCNVSFTNVALHICASLPRRFSELTVFDARLYIRVRRI